MPKFNPNKRESQKIRLRFLDIGFGNAKRIAACAARPRSSERLFLGIDADPDLKKKLQTLASRKNVRLDFAHARAGLAKIPAGSLHVVNMDFPTVIAEMEARLIQYKKPVIFLHEFPELLIGAKRVLRRNGRLYVTAPLGGVEPIKAYLQVAGFSEIRHWKLSEKEKNVTASTAEHFRMAKKDPLSTPFRISCVKR
jgi:SAM-dependent methyltransferase